MASHSASADLVLDVDLRSAAEGAADAVRRRAHFDVNRWIAGASGLRRIVELARAQAAPAEASAPADGPGLRAPGLRGPSLRHPRR